MCLAAAYSLQGENLTLVGEDISRIDVRLGYIVLTDFLGQETVVPGVLQSVDLMDNNIYIASPSNEIQ